MLYFTFGNPGQSITAIYNGRTAFVPGAGEDEVRRFLQNETIDSDLYRKLYHELCHQNLFLITESGHLLSGFRFIARLFWKAKHNVKYVNLYYRARTIFYVNMREVHERIVEEIENSENKNRIELSPNLSTIIKENDSKIIKQWQDDGVNLSIIMHITLKKLGELMSRNFSIVCGRVVDGEWKESWVSNGGIVNDRETKRPGQGIGVTMLKWLAAPFQIENWFKNTIDQKIESDWRWLQIKFTEEYKATVCKGIWDKASFDDYMFCSLRFAAKWSEFRSYKYFFEIVASINSAVYQDKNQEINQNWLNEPTFHKFINFFYLHGN